MMMLAMAAWTTTTAAAILAAATTSEGGPWRLRAHGTNEWRWVAGQQLHGSAVSWMFWGWAVLGEACGRHWVYVLGRCGVSGGHVFPGCTRCSVLQWDCDVLQENCCLLKRIARQFSLDSIALSSSVALVKLGHCDGPATPLILER
jgi:hypothetical protein